MPRLRRRAGVPKSAHGFAGARALGNPWLRSAESFNRA